MRNIKSFLLLLLSLIVLSSCSENDDVNEQINASEFILLSVHVEDVGKEYKIDVHSDYFTIDYEYAGLGDVNGHNYEGNKIIPNHYEKPGDYQIMISGTNIREIDCSDNNISVIQAISSTLEKIVCANNQMKRINIANLPKLNYLNCSSNEIEELTIGGHNKLKSLICENNKLTNLNLANCSSLEFLQCVAKNPLKELDITNCVGLKTLGLNKYKYDKTNKLTTLKMNGCKNIENFKCDYNALTSLDLTPFTKLVVVSCKKNQLVSLKLGQVSNLIRLIACENKLETEALTDLIKALPDRSDEYGYSEFFNNPGELSEKAKEILVVRNWKVFAEDGVEININN